MDTENLTSFQNEMAEQSVVDNSGEANNKKPMRFENKLDKKAIIKRLLILAIPIAIQNLLSALLNIVDSVMVQSLGQAEMGAILLVNQFIFIFQVIVFGIAGVGVIFISQYWGKGEEKKIVSVFGFTSIIVVGLSVLFTVFSLIMPEVLLRTFFRPESEAVLVEGTKFLKIVAWSFLPFGIATLISISLRGVGKVYMSMIVSGAVIFVNFFFNYVFMFGKLNFPALGIGGAAVGTVIARCVEMIVVIFMTKILKYPLFNGLSRMFKFDPVFLKRYIKLVIPAVANELFWVVGTSLYLTFFAQLPNSEVALSAVNITQAFDKIAFVVLIGLGNSVGVVVGNDIGARNEKNARLVAKVSIIFGVFLGLAVCVLMCACIPLVPIIYDNVSSEALFSARILIVIFAVFMPIRAIAYTLIVGVLRAGGDTLFCMFVDAGCVWIIGVPCIAIFSLIFHWPVHILYLFVFLEEVIKAIVVFLRFKYGKWMRNMVKDDVDEGKSPNEVATL